jgi:large subunit ribosomal protein L25
MDFAKVTAEIRTQVGKGPNRRARAAGKLPAILYGHKQAPLGLLMNTHALISAQDKERKRNTVFTLEVTDGKKGEDVMAMIRDVQIDPLTKQPIHVDFIRVSLDEEIPVSVPLVVTGTAIGVTNGGNLHLSHHTLPIVATPAHIPVRIEVDVTSLDIGNALHAKDLVLPTGVRTTLAPKEGVVSVVAPIAEKVETPVVAAEGAAPAAGAAAPAAGDKAAAAGAAPAAGAAKPAAAGAKKEEKKGK